MTTPFKLIQRANARISEGEAELTKGQSLIVGGSDKMQQAESLYQQKKNRQNDKGGQRSFAHQIKPGMSG